jgi:hypothetical protein
MRALQAELERLIQAETKELGGQRGPRTHLGTLEMELLERELAELTGDQRTDASVLSAWDPADAAALKSALEELAAARTGEARAERLKSAAETLRETAGGDRGLESRGQGVPPLADDLAAAAEAEERAARAGGDPSAEASAEALRKAAEAGARGRARHGRPRAARRDRAHAARARRRSLGTGGPAARAPARAAEGRAEEQLTARSPRANTAGGQAAEEALKPLRESRGAGRHRRGAGGGREALEDAERALRESQEALDFLGQGPRALAERGRGARSAHRARARHAARQGGRAREGSGGGPGRGGQGHAGGGAGRPAGGRRDRGGARGLGAGGARARRGRPGGGAGRRGRAWPRPRGRTPPPSQRSRRRRAP